MSSSGQIDDPAARALSEVDAADAELQDAFDRIIDAVETLIPAGETAESAVAETIDTATGAILEASAMRDILGQRLTAIRDSVALLAAGSASGLETKRDKSREIEEKQGDGSASESGLLNGPQMPGAAKSQAEVDALFDKLD